MAYRLHRSIEVGASPVYFYGVESTAITLGQTIGLPVITAGVGGGKGELMIACVTLDPHTTLYFL